MFADKGAVPASADVLFLFDFSDNTFKYVGSLFYDLHGK